MVSGEALKKLQEQIAAWPMTQRFVVQQLIEDYRRNREDLRAYKATGLTPEEVLPKDKADEIALKLMRLADLESICSYTRLRELAEADRDGRLVVRPYRIGETVYALLKDGAIFYPETNGWYISEEIVGAISHDGFYLGDPVDDVYTPDSEIGKTVFLTKKAAKAALEAMKDG